MFYVYHLIDPRCGSVFYVGKGQRDRVAAHEAEAKAGSEHPKCQRIREIWACGMQVVRKQVKKFKDEQAAYDYEADEIRRIGLKNLTNIAPGGGSVRKDWLKPADPADSAKMMCKYIAHGLWMKARGLYYKSDVLNEMTEYLLTVTCKRIWLKVGTEFMVNELKKYGINATFPDAPQQIQA